MMPTIIIEAPTGTMRVEAEGDEALIDICDEVMAPIPFSCRSATCGTCGVRIVEGQELVDPPGGTERMLRDQCGRDGRRFACALRVRPGRGTLRLRVCGRHAS